MKIVSFKISKKITTEMHKQNNLNSQREENRNYKQQYDTNDTNNTTTATSE